MDSDLIALDAIYCFGGFTFCNMLILHCKSEKS